MIRGKLTFCRVLSFQGDLGLAITDDCPTFETSVTFFFTFFFILLQLKSFFILNESIPLGIVSSDECQINCDFDRGAQT